MASQNLGTSVILMIAAELWFCRNAAMQILGKRSTTLALSLKFARQFFRGAGRGLQFTNATLQRRPRLQRRRAFEQFAGVFQMLGHAAARFAGVLAADGDEDAPMQLQCVLRLDQL